MIALMAVLLGACATLGIISKGSVNNRGQNFVHKTHENEGLDCDTCHEQDDNGWPGMPDHEVCSACHDIDQDKPDESCTRCHTRPDHSVDSLVKKIGEEVIFTHKAHIDGEVECITCHDDVNRRALSAPNTMKWCMDCHAKNKPELNECSTCHTQLKKDEKPTQRKGAPIAHDNMQLWEKVHGRESQEDMEFCLICHDQETSCEECHQRKAPEGHNLAWRRKSHGVRAAWDRQNCAVCHEEETCDRCHKKTEPENHRGAWGFPVNRHCISCHFPPDKSECAMCHEDISHSAALPSPHNLGWFGNCKLCHPGGVPYRAPHIMNTSVPCLVCH